MARPLRGLIASASDSEVLINLGALHGVQAGDQFAVLEGGEAVEVGGRTLHRRMTQVAVLRVVSVEEEVSICEIVPGSLRSGSALAKEMKVQEIVVQPI